MAKKSKKRKKKSATHTDPQIQEKSSVSSPESILQKTTNEPPNSISEQQRSEININLKKKKKEREDSPKVSSNSSGTIGWREWWSSHWPTGDDVEDTHIQWGLIFIALLIYATQLGFGLWDCWEPHYAETARMMLVRKDWIHPYWSYAYFLSKPVLMFWYMAASMSLFGVTEWAIRLPFALHAVFLIWSVYFVTSRLFTMRAGLLAALVVGTAPLTVFLGRQAIVDIIVASYIMAGLGFFALAVLGRRQDRDKAQQTGQDVPIHLPYLYFFYFLMGLTLLAKGLLGVGLAGFVILLYLLISNDWRLLLRVRLVSGIFLTLLISLPWYLHMSFFPGRNIDDSKTFFNRFILHDNIYRLFKGVHGERGTFVYFIRQLGYSLGTWVGFLPVALLSVARFKTTAGDLVSDDPQTEKSLSPFASVEPHEKLKRFLFAWWMGSFLLFSLSQTKFHHYVYPLVPISAILIALWLERYLSEERNDLYRIALLFILAFLVLVFKDIIDNPHHLVNLFVYKYSRPYPWKDPMLMFGIDWKITIAHFKFFFYPTPQVVLRDIMLAALFFLLAGIFYNVRKWLIWGLAGTGMFFAIYNAHSFMPHLAKHWSQKKIFEKLKEDSPLWRRLLKDPLADARKDPIPDEPLLAFRMNWRGEKFYSRNRDLQIMGTDSYTRLHAALQRLRKKGKPVYFLIESTRMKQLKRAVGTYDAKRLKILYKGNNKYYLVKLLPKPPDEHQDPSVLRRDARTRAYYDNWVKKWRKKNRRKKKK